MLEEGENDKDDKEEEDDKAGEGSEGPQQAEIGQMIVVKVPGESTSVVDFAAAAAAAAVVVVVVVCVGTCSDCDLQRDEAKDDEV